jgi:hypothetical protein
MLLRMWDALFGSSPAAVLRRQLVAIVANSIVIGLSAVIGYTNWAKGGNAYWANMIVIPALGFWVYLNCRHVVNGTQGP